MKEEMLLVEMEHKRLMLLFLSVVVVFSAYALAVVIAPLSLYQKGIAVFFAAAPAGMFLYSIWKKAVLIEEKVRRL